MRNRSWTCRCLPSRSTIAVLTALVMLLGLSVPPAGVAAAGDPTVYWGAKAGPVSIPAKKWRTVAALPLPKGRYSVTATATLMGRSSPDYYQRVTCRLVLGDWRDLVKAVPAREDGGSRVPIMLSVAGRLPSPAKARLRCYGAGAQSHVAIRDIRMTAIKVGRLTLQDGVGSGAKRRTLGSASPRAISAKSIVGAFVHGTDTYQTVGSLDLPKGRWWVTAKAVAYARGNPGLSSTNYYCRLRTGVDHDDLRFEMVSHASPADSSRVPLGLQVVHSFPAAGAAVLQCQAPSSMHSTTMLIDHVVITAVKAGRITNIRLDAPGRWDAGQGSPRVISGWDNGPVNIPIRSTYKTIGKLDLPKGRWTVLAKLWFAARWPGGPPSDAGTTHCRLKFGSHKSPTQYRYGSEFTRYEPLVMSINHHATTKGPVKLQCRRVAREGLGRAHYIKITAMKAGSLIKRPL